MAGLIVLARQRARGQSLIGPLRGFQKLDRLSVEAACWDKAVVLHALQTVRGDGVGFFWIQLACHCMCPFEGRVDVGNGGGLIILVGFACGDRKGCMAFADLVWSAWMARSMWIVLYARRLGHVAPSVAS